ncbi:MAG: anthranilate synthase component I family protein [Actinobacteria bacterium]|nr:anthranilate synthase component I family protein [Actinomycetota bacterium]
MAERSPAAIARAIGLARKPLVLEPSGASGWFGGMSLVCADPVADTHGADLREAASALEAVMNAEEPLLAAAIVPYDGTGCRIRLYRGGLMRTDGGWEPWGEPGDLRADDLGEPPVPAASPAPETPLLADARFDLAKADYLARVEAVRSAIRDGDVYVLNLTMRLQGTLRTDVAAAFEALLGSSAGPMSAMWAAEESAIVSVSPERFLAVTAESPRTGGVRHAEIQPIKGTRPRGADPVTDARLAAELAASAKERAEHLMIVDLERNDLGRVCETGSVIVEPLFEVFATPYCHQLVSGVRGRLRPDATIAELLEAAFPCGSVTGAPKIAAMRLIRELEVTPRGAYTGALVVAMPGRMDSSVLIRTLELDGTTARWGTGGGITIDSDPEAEWLEALLKARPVLGG